MKMPAFTADASLSKLGEDHAYRSVEYTPDLGLVEPAFCLVCGYREEMQYLECYRRCMSGGGYHSACRRTCCMEVAGCSSCIFC